MSYQATYADNPLHDYLTIYNIERTILPSRENSSKQVNGMHGEYYTNYRYGNKEITLKCGITATDKEHYREIFRELAFLLDVKSPQKLILSDEPERYVYAVPSGETSINRKFNTANFDLKFVCYNPYEYAIEQKDTLSEGEDETIEMSNKHILDIYNEGTVDIYPTIKATFYDTAHFFQCTNYQGRTVLVGTPPSIDVPKATVNPVVLEDKCTTLEGWNNVGNVLDGDVKRIIDGSLTINKGGYAITCSNYGTSDDDTWHGGAGRKNLSKSIENFRIEIDMEHSSGGTLNSVSNPSDSGSSSGTVNYIVTAKSALNVRSSRSTKGKVITTIPKGKKIYISSIQSKWGKVTYNNKTGYVSMSMVKKISTSSSSSSNKYKTKIQVNLRKGRGTKYSVLKKIPKSTTLAVSSISNNWGKVTYNNKTGYVYMKNLSKVSTTRADEHSDAETKEDRMGRCEVYLFDENGNKLAKVLMRDSSSYYHYSEPEMFIGSKLLVSDGLSTPKAKTIKVKEDDKTVTKKVDSGNYGDWNEFDGKFTIERTTKNGKQYWNLKVVKYKNDGTIAKKIEKTGLNSSSYPAGKLASIVIWFGSYGKHIPVDVQNVSNIKVTELNPKDTTPVNLPIFKAGDELLIDFDTQEVLLNREECIDQLDIGSDFFGVSAGQEEIMCVSDTTQMIAHAEYRDVWL